MKENFNRITSTILSMSLLTVMAGAAIAPALGKLQEHFAACPPLLIQFVVSIPALFIILTNLLFLTISQHFGTRTIAVTGLLAYVAAGAGCYFADNILLLLALRALLGVSVGLIMPLSTGLLAYYNPPEEQPRLMGLSAAMNQLGGVIATLLAGLLASFRWNYTFLVYLLGILSIILVIKYLPNDRLQSSNKRGKPFAPAQLLKFHPSVVSMLLLMMIFFIFPTNFAITAHVQTHLSLTVITLIMVGLDVVAFFAGLFFKDIMHDFRLSIKYFAPVFFLAGYMSLAFGSNSLVLLILGVAWIGIANGVGVPYLNTIASIKGERNSATTVMPLLSAALYLGQFLSPIVITPLAHILFGAFDINGCYKVGILFCLLFMFQTWSTRHYQSLPPKS